MRIKPWTAVLCLAFLVACDDNGSGPGGGGGGATEDLPYELVDAFPGAGFNAAVGLANAGDGSGRFFVVEQAGRIIVVDGGTTSVFLDIRTRVDDAGFELGLLGLAFHPDYETNGYFYVYYTTVMGARIGQLSRFQVSADPGVADALSEAKLLSVTQWSSNHNGGALFFDNDGYLYLGLGDGGGAGDPQNNAQNPTNLLGSIIRLDVDAGADTPPYHSIPADNPFVGNSDGWREEIYAYGLRNPWRASVDPVTGEMRAGDVGQAQWEEINLILSGRNYGWDCREGLHPYTNGPDGPSPACDSAGPLQDPVFEYSHSDGNLSITGGYVYRGPSHPELTGKYIYGDWGSGRIWAIQSHHTGNELIARAPNNVSSFGVGEDNELYVVERGAPGKVYRLEETQTEEE